MKTPIAVLTSDVHYNVQTLAVAETAMARAVALANSLKVPLVVAGDLHDSKANLRGECIKAIRNRLIQAKQCYVLVGNHDLWNERSKDHSLEFLKYTGVIVIEKPEFIEALRVFFVPYQSNPDDFKAALNEGKKFGRRFICHQGVTGSNAGHYIQDKSAVPADWFDDCLIYSGHYHTRQVIPCGKSGLFYYIGNPYSLNFGEASDPDKGIQILYNDGILKFVPINLRRHRVYEFQSDNIQNISQEVDLEDPLWIKVSGTQVELSELSKDKVAQLLGISQSFRLDLIPTAVELFEEVQLNAPQEEVLDNVIDGLSGTDISQKIRVKELWRNLL